MDGDTEIGGEKSRLLESAVWGCVLILVYAALVSLPLIIAFGVHPETDEGPVAELGKGFALVGVALLALQFVMAARLRWIERPFGLDIILSFHKAMGVFAAILILLHPILLAASGGWGLLYNIRQPWFIWLGKIALLLLLILAASAVLRPRLAIAYETWRRRHNLAIVIFGLAFIHSAVVGDDMHNPAMWGLWLGFLGIAVSAYAYHKAIIPWSARRSAFVVHDVKSETHDVWTLELEPPAGATVFDYRPGQFQFLTLFRGDRGCPIEEHPFTIASSPTESNLCLSIKASGDFTATVRETRVGDRAAVRGPYGRFSYTYDPGNTDLVFIAGGIGVTPFLSMLRHMRDTEAPIDVLLIWGNKSAKDIAFREELGDMAAAERPSVRVVHVLSDPGDDWKGEAGYVDRGIIERLAGEGLAGKTYYVCGPPVMMEKVFANLRSLGVSSGRVLYERFAL